MRSTALIVSLLLSTLLTACSSSEKRPEELTEQEYYEQAQEAIDDNNFLIASERLKELESRYPFGRYAEQAQLELIYAQHMMSDLEGALASAQRFIRLHPLHAQVDYAYYMRGLATYELGFSFVERYFPSEQARRDQTAIRDAFGYFDELIRRFPDSRYNADAAARMQYIRDRLAQYEVGVARFYMKRHAYLAAAKRAEKVLMNFQQTSAVADALAIQVEAYQLLEQDVEASRMLAILKNTFPDHPQFDENGEFQPSGLTEEDRRTLIGVISFGLID